MPRKKKKNKASRSASSFVREFGEDAVQMFPVHEEKVVHGRKQYRFVCFVTRPERDEMIANGSGASMTAGSAVRLLITLEQFRGQSATMGPRVIEAAAGLMRMSRAAQAHVKSLVDAWA